MTSLGRALLRATLTLLVLGSPLLARAEEEQPSVRVSASVEPERGAIVGQKVLLRLELATPTWFTAAPSLPEPRIEGAIVKRFGSTGVNGSAQIEGRAYTTQIWEWHVYPRRAGTFEVPALAATVRSAGEDRKTVEVEGGTEPLTFAVEEPAGARGRSYAFAAPAFRLEETLDPELGRLRVGDALRRTITMRVEDAPGMLLPPLEAGRLPGAGVYADAPRVDDAYERGSLAGTRIESVSYVFQREGRVELPAIRIPWWNTKAGRLEEAVVEGHALQVDENPDLDPEQLARLRGETSEAGAREDAETAWRELLLWIVALATVLLVGGWLARRYGPEWKAARAARRRRKLESEATAFENLERACRGGNGTATLAALRAWVDRLPGPALMTIEEAVERSGSAAFRREIATLQEHLFGGRAASASEATSASSGGWSGAALASAAAAARPALLRGAARAGALEDLRLNPRTGN